jgi:transcriptional regulator with XRE-family HTH domain
MDADKHRNVCGPTIRRLRTAREWSQEQLAAKCQLAGLDITRFVVASIESRRRVLADTDLLTLAKVFRVPMEQLFPRR